MNIAHIAIWVKDLEAMKDFYSRYFEGKSNEKYVNPLKGFESYFISFESGAKLELMHKQSINKSKSANNGNCCSNFCWNIIFFRNGLFSGLGGGGGITGF